MAIRSNKDVRSDAKPLTTSFASAKLISLGCHEWQSEATRKLLGYSNNENAETAFSQVQPCTDARLNCGVSGITNPLCGMPQQQGNR